MYRRAQTQVRRTRADRLTLELLLEGLGDKCSLFTGNCHPGSGGRGAGVPVIWPLGGGVFPRVDPTQRTAELREGERWNLGDTEPLDPAVPEAAGLLSLVYANTPESMGGQTEPPVFSCLVSVWQTPPNLKHQL